MSPEHSAAIDAVVPRLESFLQETAEELGLHHAEVTSVVLAHIVIGISETVFATMAEKKPTLSLVE